MNSQIVVGVGNIYASEALFRARIAPRRAARRITRAEAHALAQSIKEVLGELRKSPIRQITQGQRSTYWCAVCQR